MSINHFIFNTKFLQSTQFRYMSALNSAIIEMKSLRKNGNEQRN